tara:strand:+ start:104 stop:316 length:213 start_codon:yes stop_codon:yes gene_type:complete
MSKNNPPKNRDFLGLVKSGENVYWDIFFYARKEDGVRKAEFVDRGLFSMPALIRWVEMPSIEESDYDKKY